MADRRSRSPSRSRTARSALLATPRFETRTVNARGTEISVPLDTLQRIPYFQKRLQGGWLDSEDSKAYVPIDAMHFHVILDIMEYARQDDTQPEEFIPSTIPIAAVLGAASMLGLVEAQPEVEQTGPSNHGDSLSRTFRTLQLRGKMELSMRAVTDTRDCRMCGNPFVPSLNNPEACACHPVACLIKEGDTSRCTQCQLSVVVGRAWNLRDPSYFCYKGPHLPKATEEARQGIRSEV